MSAPGELPPLPSYTVEALSPVLPPIPDKYLTLILPIVAYWVVSMFFHVIDINDIMPQYRLHTPAEVLKRNHVSRWEVVRDVVIQQVVQTLFGIGLALYEPDQMTGMDDYNVAVWAQRIRIAQHALPSLFAVVGVDSKNLADRVLSVSPSLSGALAGGSYPWLVSVTDESTIVPAFSPWETTFASIIYWILIPALQFGLGIFIVDTWQYFLHRAMHMNKYLYTTFHARHHRLYVPYAYGALYNHPFEGFLLDTCGTGIAYLVAGMTPRQSMWFFTCSTIKTVDDHCGYALPFDPLQHITSNNAGYHDVHHQSWGIKTNFSQPFFTFWDRLLGTVWAGGDVSARYERARIAAQKKVDQDGRKEQFTESITASDPIDSALDASSSYDQEIKNATNLPPTVHANALPQVPSGKATQQAIGSRAQVVSDKAGGGQSVIAEETAEEQAEVERLRRRSPRKKTNPASSTSNPAGSLKGLRNRVSSGSGFHGRTGSLIGYDSR